MSGGIDEKAAPFELGLVFDCYGKSANEEGLVLVCFEELGEGFETAKETGKVTRDELPSVVGPQQNAVGFVNGLLREQRRSLFDHNVHDDLRRSASMALGLESDVCSSDLISLMRAGAHLTISIEGIAERSGFKSKSIFYAAFKEEYNMTPTEWIKKNL